MANKLYFKYGTMNSGKTALALMCKFNYEQKGFNVLLLKSCLDNRDVANDEIIVKSRVGLTSKCFIFTKDDSIIGIFEKHNKQNKVDVIIVDECQFATTKQIDELHFLAQKIPVLCYGLLTDFQTHLFEGSKRLIETAESLQELKSVCDCGKKATINARFVDNKLCLKGDTLAIEKGNVSYKSVCYKCFSNLVKNNKE